MVAYEGTGYHGFAANEGVPTVAGALTAAIERVLRHPVTITCAGRTDAGVHAWGQVVTFDAPEEELDLIRLQRSVNGLCGPSIVVREVSLVSDDVDARFSARWRRYHYQVLNREVPDPFLARTAWHVPHPLDLRRLRLACDPLIGEHDFASFCRRPRVGPGQPEATLVRRVRSAGWVDLGEGLLRFEITANAFCHQMVRSIVGTLVEVGAGKRSAGSLLDTLRARDRATAGVMAPPHGLCLWQVGYDG